MNLCLDRTGRRESIRMSGLAARRTTPTTVGPTALPAAPGVRTDAEPVETPAPEVSCADSPGPISYRVTNA